MIRILQIPASRVPLPGARTYVCDEGASIALFNVQGKVYAIDDSCPHSGGSLSAGKLEGLMLQCPAHGLKFDIATGCMRGGSSLRVRSYPVSLVDGTALIRLSATTYEENIQ
jgi:3-phenylpropionate/trans-cinnamate dioxygenase ferredoxin subunit